nr:hypothetical protein [Tanacetum cinerariifolium]
MPVALKDEMEAT